MTMLTAACLALGLPLAAMQADDLASPKLRVDWTEFKALYDANKAVVVDVRSAEAFEGGHIPGARSIPLATVAAHAGELKKLNRPILVYCA
jgi:rhodanese-related sulfurtransferase